MSRHPLEGMTVMVVDTETTGFDPYGREQDRIVQVACLPVVDGVPGEPWTSFVQPGRPIPDGASNIHGIKDDTVKNAPAYPDIAPILRERLADHWLAFHNAHFDVPFLRHLFESTRTAPLTAPVIDTLGLARRLNKGGNNSLKALASTVGMAQQDGRHEAGSDTRITAALLVKLLPQWLATQGEAPLVTIASHSLEESRRRPYR